MPLGYPDPDSETSFWFRIVCPKCDLRDIWQPWAFIEEIPNGRKISLRDEDAACPRCSYALMAGDKIALCRDEGSETVESTTYVIPQRQEVSANRVTQAQLTVVAKGLKMPGGAYARQMQGRASEVGMLLASCRVTSAEYRSWDRNRAGQVAAQQSYGPP